MIGLLIRTGYIVTYATARTIVPGPTESIVMILSAIMSNLVAVFNQGDFGRIIDHLIIFGHELRHLFLSSSVYFPSAFTEVGHGAGLAGGKTRLIKSDLACLAMSGLQIIMVLTISYRSDRSRKVPTKNPWGFV